MFNEKELIWIIIVIIIFEFMIVLKIDEQNNLAININPLVLLVPIIIILTNLITKKIAAPFYNIKIEYSIWKFQRFGYYERSYLKKPFPIGLVFPFFMAFFSLGIIKPLTFLQFEAKNLPKKRLLKRRGRERRSEINESDLAFTSAWGFYALLLVSVIGMLFEFKELALYPVYYTLWNLIPLSNLDGTKLFFGSFPNWVLLLILSIFTLAMAVMIV